MPHGFAVKRVVAEEVPNPLASDLLIEQRITIDMTVPTICSSDTGPRGRRARLQERKVTPDDEGELRAVRFRSAHVWEGPA